MRLRRQINEKGRYTTGLRVAMNAEAVWGWCCLTAPPRPAEALCDRITVTVRSSDTLY